MSIKVDTLVITRPAVGQYSPDVLRMESRLLKRPEQGEVLLRVLYLSLDPTNRNWLKLEPTNTVAEKIGRNIRIGDPMVGELLGIIEESNDPEYRVGDYVGCVAEWQEKVVVPTCRLRRLERREGEPLTLYSTVLSHIGMAAMVGMIDIARVQPGEIVLVSSAAGATGSIAVGIAKSLGCKVIGIAGGPSKCRRVREEFGADAVIDYKSEDVEEALGRIVPPEGVDVYFDNVGGTILDAALMHMARGGRVAVCGNIATYDGNDDLGVKNMFQVLIRHLRIEGYLANHYNNKRELYYERLRELLSTGKISHREHRSAGLSSAPEHLANLFTGANEAKLIVEVSADPYQPTSITNPSSRKQT